MSKQLTLAPGKLTCEQTRRLLVPAAAAAGESQTGVVGFMERSLGRNGQDLIRHNGMEPACSQWATFVAFTLALSEQSLFSYQTITTLNHLGLIRSIPLAG